MPIHGKSATSRNYHLGSRFPSQASSFIGITSAIEIGLEKGKYGESAGQTVRSTVEFSRLRRAIGQRRMVNVGKYEKRLIGRLNELNDRLESIEDDLDEPADQDAEERATEREGDEVLESLGNAGLMEIKMIQAALGRIKNGTFGVCVNCGEDISEERLETVPHAPRCRNCA